MIRRMPRFVLGAMAAGVMTVGSVQAEQSTTRDGQQKQMQDGKQQTGSDGASATRSPEKKLRQVSGQVVAVKAVDITGTDHKNTVVLLKTSKQDKRLVVDLGPQTQFKKPITNGQQIAAEGPVANVGDEPVLVATRIKLGNQVMQVDRQAQLQAGKNEGATKAQGRKK